MMRYITYEIINNCIHKVKIKPGKAVGFGFTYRDAVENALRFECNHLFAVEEEKPTPPKPQYLQVQRLR